MEKSTYNHVPKAIEKIRDLGLEIGSFRFIQILNELFGISGGEKVVDAICCVIQILEQNYIRVIQFDTYAIKMSTGGVPGYSEKEWRAGYMLGAFTLKR